MTPTRWQRIQDLVNGAIELPASARGAFLESNCGSDHELRQQIEKLIDSYNQADSFIEHAIEAGAHQALSAKAPAPGDRIGPYQIIGVIGHGGMGTVYLAERADEHFRQQVAIKIVRAGIAASTELVTRFRAERQILASLTHPNIARLLDGGITETGLPYLAMEFIEGRPIDEFARDRQLSIRGRLELFRKLCAAVQYAHQNLVVHRDLKPANVVVTEDGTPKLLDFGIAKLLSPDSIGQTVAFTRPAERLMTPEYASPEQIRGDTITTATDVYALGVLLYELLTGKRPYQTANLSPANIERLICDSNPERPSTAGAASQTSKESGKPESIPADLDNIVLMAMHKEPARRYSSAAELSEDVQRYLDGFPVKARTDEWRYRTRKFVSRHKAGVAAATIVMVMISALSIGLAIQVTRTRREAATAEQVSNFLVSLFRFARPEETQGRGVSAREILDRGASRVHKEMAAQPAVESNLLNTLGNVYINLGALDEAEKLHRQAYEIRVREFGAGSIEAAESLHALGYVARDRGDYQRAATSFDETLRVYRKVEGRNGRSVATILNNIALLRWDMGEFAAAEQTARESVSINIATRGPNDVLTLTSRNNLEIILADQGDYRAAEPLAREVLDARLKVLGPNHPHVAVSLNNVSFLLAKAARFVEAEAMSRQVLELRRKVFGAEHPEIAQALRSLSWMSRELGHYEEARRLGEEAIAMSTKLVGPRTADTANGQDVTALALIALADFNGARSLLKTALATRQSLLRPGRPQLADVYDHIGLADFATNQLTEARGNFEQARDIRRQFYGGGHLNVAESLCHVGRVLSATGDYVDAEKQYREALRIVRSKFPGPHTIAAEALLGLGAALTIEGKLTEAEAPLRESLDIRRKLLPVGHPSIAESSAELDRWSKLKAGAGRR